MPSGDRGGSREPLSERPRPAWSQSLRTFIEQKAGVCSHGPAELSLVRPDAVLELAGKPGIGRLAEVPAERLPELDHLIASGRGKQQAALYGNAIRPTSRQRPGEMAAQIRGIVHR